MVVMNTGESNRVLLHKDLMSLFNFPNKLASSKSSLKAFNLIIVISSDRGLCGGYNTNVIRRAENRAKELAADGIDYKFVLIGRKAIQYFESYFQLL